MLFPYQFGGNYPKLCAILPPWHKTGVSLSFWWYVPQIVCKLYAPPSNLTLSLLRVLSTYHFGGSCPKLFATLLLVWEC